MNQAFNSKVGGRKPGTANKEYFQAGHWEDDPEIELHGKTKA